MDAVYYSILHGMMAILTGPVASLNILGMVETRKTCIPRYVNRSHKLSEMLKLIRITCNTVDISLARVRWKSFVCALSHNSA